MRTARRCLVGSALLALISFASVAPASAAGPLTLAAHPTVPAFQPSWATNTRQSDAPDPAVVRVGSTYYAYTTGTMWGNHIGVLVSSQPSSGWHTLQNRSFGSSAFGSLPAGTSVRPWQINGSQHAPGVFAFAGKYVMFYTAQTVSGHGGHYCLSVATASAPAGPFSDTSSGPLLCRDSEGGVIDPQPFVDAAGNPWLYFKTYDDVNHGSTPARIYAVALSGNGQQPIGTAHIVLAQESLTSPFETVENPQMIRAGGRYVLVFSRGLYTSNAYRMGDALCDGPAGPCHESTSSLVTTYPNAGGPGGGTAFADASGRLWLTYAAWNTGCTQYRVDNSCARRLFVAPLNATGPIVCHAVNPVRGYRMVASDGGIFVFGTEQFCGSTGDISLNSPIVGMARTPSSGGYWLVASDGGIFSFGDAHFYGSTGAIHLNQPIVGMTASPSGHGYWFVARDGGIFSFGDAHFYGSTGAIHLNSPIVGMAATRSGHGYWLVAADGGVFSFGDAHFFGSTGAIKLNQPIVGMAPSPTGHGYWFVARDGGIFSFGDARFFGSTGAIKLNQPIVGMSASASGHGYWFVAADGGIFSFGDAHFYGSTGSVHLVRPIVGIA
ncbi:MAG TPA: family 43 glycosylhydrolase [Acidimicrobiia bacterium]|nr:family 43 glycosylhydrolase [Acidimicrobiia bacterium]